METKTFLIIEMLVLFVIIPIGLVLNVHPAFKLAPITAGMLYVTWVVYRQKLITFRSLYELGSERQWMPIMVKWVALIILTTTMMYLFDQENMFVVVRKNWQMWVGITMFYSLFSVYPQELLYRSFFFSRYATVFKSKHWLITANALIFSLAHIGFQNWLVSALTLVGGFFFAITYTKSRSLMLVSIEHAIYGSWLFTVGMGEMLAFPVPS